MTDSPAVIFDLDGTLVDTAPDLLGALNAVLEQAGHRTIEPAELRHLAGHGVRALFERTFAVTGAAVTPEQMARYGEDFLAHYRFNIAEGSRPFPRVPETLEALTRAGARLGVCTNKPHDLATLLLSELDLSRHFGAVIGAGVAPANKPDARHVRAVVDALKGRHTHAVLVGDSPVDVAAARAAGIPVIAMSYGYTPVPVHELGADLVADDFADVPELVARLLG